MAAALQFFVCEFVVAATWDGNYSYSRNFISDLGLPYCGPTGLAPCGSSALLINISFVVLGCALAAAAVWEQPTGSARLIGATFLLLAGVGAVIVGLVTSKANWPLHSLGATLFLIFGSCAALAGGLSTFTDIRRRLPALAAAFAFLGFIGYFAYSNKWQLGLGPGGVERLSAYAVILGFVCSVHLVASSRTDGANQRASLRPEPQPDDGGKRQGGPGRRSTAAFALISIGLVTLAGFSAERAKAAPVGPVTTMSDEFDGASGSAPDSNTWSYDLGGGGWGNGEVQTYTDDRANVQLDGSGHLAITAVREADGSFTSARITTRNSLAFTNGRAEARIRVPAGDGIHPAFWLLGTDIDGVGWPRSGEIDVVETINDAMTSNCALHGPTVSGGDYQLSGNTVGDDPFSADFHDYWVQRSPGRISMGVDQHVTCAFTAADVDAHETWVFDQPFYLLLNVAVGGKYPGPATSRTPTESTMLVDWVRVTS
ncbi:family 16 glycosylhydrolase [Mycobacterium yunnanensis]|uniref:Family 16 glycosylhydrolase n=1 Tax=Mycobacterium yunnanensis TaxID=368477 RepID=A0A9X2Z5F5_9MYCO|nr:family 16 glycosylhydrolase [Mycobacterium yunnanensis]MCV7423760.1 family 16 glycosylhydrolase [Mycobacterium yunnanensis]